MTLVFAPRKPRKCPRCGADSVASIMYGFPAMTTEVKKKIAQGSLVLGSCCMEVVSPMWQCTACNTGIYHERDRMNMDENG